MDAQEYRMLYEAYKEVINQQVDEEYKKLPKRKMGMKSGKKALQAIGHGWKGGKSATDSTEQQIEYQKKDKKASQADKMNRVSSTHSPEQSKKKSLKNQTSGLIKRLDAKNDAARATKNEEVYLYDIILSYLLDEGYAETPEAAEAIMVNMSEEWRDSITG